MVPFVHGRCTVQRGTIMLATTGIVGQATVLQRVCTSLSDTWCSLVNYDLVLKSGDAYTSSCMPSHMQALDPVFQSGKGGRGLCTLVLPNFDVVKNICRKMSSYILCVDHT